MYVLCIVRPLGTVSDEEEVSQNIDDTFSHITTIADGSSSDRRDSPDGGEEETLPFPVPSSADHTSRTEVCPWVWVLGMVGIVCVGLVYVCILLISSTQFVTGLV